MYLLNTVKKFLLLRSSDFFYCCFYICHEGIEPRRAILSIQPTLFWQIWNILQHQINLLEVLLLPDFKWWVKLVDDSVKVTIRSLQDMKKQANMVLSKDAKDAQPTGTQAEHLVGYIGPMHPFIGTEGTGLEAMDLGGEGLAKHKEDCIIVNLRDVGTPL